MMIKNYLTLPVMLAVIGLTFYTERADAVDLADADRIYLVNDNITLRDLFPKSSKPHQTVMAAPPPGNSISLSAAALVRIAGRHHIDWTPPAGFKNVTVSRIGRDIDISKLNAVIAKALKPKITSAFDAVALETQLGRQKIVLPAKGPVAYRVTQVDYNTNSNHYQGLAELHFGTSDDKIVFRFSGKAALERTLPVLSRQLQRGGIIRADDVVTQNIAVHQFTGEVITDADELIGMQARYRLKADQPLLRRDVQMPLIVKKRQTVVMVLHTGRLKITTQGIALQDGAKGDMISVRNTKSGIVVEGMIIGPETVTVTSAGSRFVDSNINRHVVN